MDGTNINADYYAAKHEGIGIPRPVETRATTGASARQLAAALAAVLGRRLS